MQYFGTAPCHASPGGTHVDAVDKLLDAVELADFLGLDGWFFPELRGLPQHSLDSAPHLLIAAASRSTTRIRLGTMVDLLPFHHPLRVAEEIRFLDTLTHGRLEVGVGPGGPMEHERWGTDPDQGRAMLEVAVTLVRGFLTGEISDYETRWWRGRVAQLSPEPMQSPHPPLWLATIGGGSIDAAARCGLNCQSGMAPLEVLSDRIDQYRAHWVLSQPETPPGRFAAMVDLVVNEDGDVARQAGRQFHERRLARRHRSVPSRTDRSARPQQRPSPTTAFAELSYPELIDLGLAICGDVQECADQMSRLAEVGVDAVTAWLPFGDVEDDLAQQSLRLFCEQVIPLVESRSTTPAAGADGRLYVGDSA